MMMFLVFRAVVCAGRSCEVGEPCEWFGADGCFHPEHPKNDAAGRQANLIYQMVEMNRAQTARCRHLLGGVRLLEEVYCGAELCECGETGQRRFTVAADEWERVAAYLADFAAASWSAMGAAGGQETEAMGGRQ